VGIEILGGGTLRKKLILIKMFRKGLIIFTRKQGVKTGDEQCQKKIQKVKAKFLLK
jgi:ribosomal protein L7Ae-like RNA K-turn-binding protein